MLNQLKLFEMSRMCFFGLDMKLLLCVDGVGSEVVLEAGTDDDDALNGCCSVGFAGLL